MQKIMNLVDADDDNVLMNKIKDLEFLINQLPNKQQPTDDKIGFKVNEDQTTDNLIDDLIDRADKIFSGNDSTSLTGDTHMTKCVILFRVLTRFLYS